MKPGDEVRVRINGFDRILVVKETLVKRVSPALAAAAYTDTTPVLPEAEKLFFAPRRERGAGRPTKRERRELEHLRDRERTD